MVFTYENEQFVEALKIETNNKNGYSYSSRGTFIGVFCTHKMVDNSKPKEYTTSKKVDCSKTIRKREDRYGFQ